jgi:N-acetylglucosamine-6-sulfatase
VRSLRSVADTLQETAAALRQTHDLRNTVIIFTSDNGFVLGEHQLTGKNMAYRDSLAVPLLIRGPGFVRGGSVSQPVSLADVTASIAFAAGVTPSYPLDGIPLQPLDNHPDQYADRPILVEGSVSEYPKAPRLRTDADNRFYLGAVTQDQMYVQYYRGRAEPNREEEFYDHVVDPWELRNGWAETPPAADALRLRSWALSHSECAGGACNDALP